MNRVVGLIAVVVLAGVVIALLISWAVRSDSGQPETERYTAGSWSVALPPTWSGRRDSECVTFDRRENGAGALQVSAYFKRSAITDEALREVASRERQKATEPEQVIAGDFAGLRMTFTKAGVAWRRWYLYRGRQLLFVTYNCAPEDTGVEAAEVDKILASLRDEQVASSSPENR